MNNNVQVNSNFPMDSHSQMTSIYDYTNNLLTTPSFFIILVIIVIIYILFFVTLGRNKENSSLLDSNSNNNNNNFNIGSNVLTIIIICIFIFLFIVNGLQYFFGVNIIASIQNMFSNQPELNIAVTNPDYNPDYNPGMPAIVPEIKIKKQVFNIPGNNYDYTDAKALCNAYGADLANYNQIENSYNNGAEWCNYGWSDGQMALFPTQQKTFDNLQNIPNHENDCGRPGINGGFMANPGLKFGVNCYGFKPKIREEEEELMHDVPTYPRTVQDITLENRVNYWKERLSEILISPFNHTNWSKI